MRLKEYKKPIPNIFEHITHFNYKLYLHSNMTTPIFRIETFKLSFNDLLDRLNRFILRTIGNDMDDMKLSSSSLCSLPDVTRISNVFQKVDPLYEVIHEASTELILNLFSLRGVILGSSEYYKEKDPLWLILDLTYRFNSTSPYPCFIKKFQNISDVQAFWNSLCLDGYSFRPLEVVILDLEPGIIVIKSFLKKGRKQFGIEYSTEVANAFPEESFKDFESHIYSGLSGILRSVCIN